MSLKVIYFRFFIKKLFSESGPKYLGALPWNHSDARYIKNSSDEICIRQALFVTRKKDVKYLINKSGPTMQSIHQNTRCNICII